MSKRYNDYQHIEASRGQLELFSHTYDKYVLGSQVVDDGCESVLDAGCSLGGIGLKLATHPGVQRVVLNNITKSELARGQEIAGIVGLTDPNDPISKTSDGRDRVIQFSDQNISDINDTFDLTLYFALIHHLLRVQTIDQILEMIARQTNKYSVIEVPVAGDALLKNIFNAVHDPERDARYKALGSCDEFQSHLEKYFTVMSVHRMNYGAGDLVRYAFVCKKI
jgi:hypothetical protein